MRVPFAREVITRDWIACDSLADVKFRVSGTVPSVEWHATICWLTCYHLLTDMLPSADWHATTCCNFEFKCLTILSNPLSLLFFILHFKGVAAALIYVAVWLVQTYGDYTKLTTDMYTLVMAGIIIGVGILILFTAVIGCCGTCRDNKCCLCVVSL